MAISNKEEKRDERIKRVPVQRAKILFAEQKPGFKRRWVNEEIGKVNDHLAAGWRLVQDPKADISDPDVKNGTSLDSAVRRVVNRDPLARATTAVLMEIPLEYFNEDYTNAQRDVDESEKGIDPKKYSGDDYYGGMEKTYS